MSDAPPPAGHNLPTLKDLLPIGLVTQMVEAETTALRKRAADLTASCQRFLTKYPTITDDEADGAAATVLAVCQRFCKKDGAVDEARTLMKAPVLAAVRHIDGEYPKISKLVVDAVAEVGKRSLAYKVAKDARLKREAQEEAARRQKEAEAAERLADHGSGTVTYQDAADLAHVAYQAEQVANQPAAERTRTHGTDVGTSSLRYKREIIVIDPLKVDRAYCSPDMAKLALAAGKAGTPLPTIAGCTVRDVPDLTVRR